MPETASLRARRRRLTLAIAGVGAVAWLAFVTVTLVLARGDLRAGLRSVDEAKRNSSPSDLAEGRPIPDLLLAAERFSEGRDRLSQPVLVPARMVPLLGRQLRSVRALSTAAAHIADTGAGAVADVERILSTADPPAGERAALVRRLRDLAAGTERRLDGVGLGPTWGLVPPLAHARADLSRQLVELREGLQKGSAGASAVADLLDGPRRYLLLAANNGEMRAGSGMLLFAGELETGAGNLRLGNLRSVVDIPVPPGTVDLPTDISERWGWLKPNEDWTSLMVSPRFDEMASVAAKMWVAAGNRPVDGVIALDPVTLAALLDATGPVTVGDVTVDGQSAVEELLHGQYLRFSNDEKLERREQLGDIARAAFEAFDAGGWSPTKLAGGLIAAARGRHLLVWSADASARAGWVAAGIDGSLGPESLLVAVLNRGGNKLDQHLPVTARLDLHPSGSDTEGALILDLHNVVPDGEPLYVAGPHPGSGVEKNVYLGILAVSLPGDALEGRVEGVDQLAVAGRDGPTRVVGFQFALAQGEHRTVTVRFRLPGRHGMIRVEPSARVPAVKWTSGRMRWEQGARTLRW